MPRNIHDVNIVDLYGDGFLNHHGIGSAVVDATGTITSITCGIFAQIKPIPKVGTEYSISGIYDDNNLPFQVNLRCTTAARPASIFDR
ncbi:hypothetical protein [Hymenobacter terrenus]|uniref:hypothetical protein n=1 Tax=Hymenobacter terrenus TaxID=1629124 RepID=UPI000AD2909A|nr:hypothetical protein [Hymenobacter terrenus]